MNATEILQPEVKAAAIPLERDVFLRSLVRELSGLLEDTVGLDEAAGFISVVGQHIGATIGDDYKRALGTAELSRAQITSVLVDLKRRIQGDFYVIGADETKVVLGNRACPFGDKVKDRPSLCMMTSNVFGTIVSDNNGYAKVALEETIAGGAPQCRATVFFEATEEAKRSEGREYFR
jgi:predicted ArsR family transcriptional regulator